MADSAASKKVENFELTSTQVENLFPNEVEPKSEFEKLPKSILTTILCKLDLTSVAKVWRLNKYFLQLLSNSTTATIFWKTVCQNASEDQIELIRIEEVVSNLPKSHFERRLNHFCLYFKYGSKLKWNKQRKGPHINIDDDYTISTGKKKKIEKKKN